MFKQAMDIVLADKESNGCWTLQDVLAGCTPANAEAVLDEWLLNHCDNGRGGWTNFGSSIINDYCRVMNYLNNLVYGEDC